MSSLRLMVSSETCLDNVFLSDVIREVIKACILTRLRFGFWSKFFLFGVMLKFPYQNL